MVSLMNLRTLLVIVSVPLIDAFCPIHGEPLEAQHRQQEIEKDSVWSICYNQYKNAAYHRPLGIAFASVDRSIFAMEQIEYRFISTPKGVQGIAADVEQQSNGSWKCKRGLIEKPMLLGKKYTESDPLYAPKPGCRNIGYGYPILSMECFGKSKIIGYSFKYSTLKEEACVNSEWGPSCLYLYRKAGQGIVSKDLIGVRAPSGVLGSS